MESNIVRRKDALAHCLPEYFTGKPCSRGHVAQRQTANGTCVECRREDKRKAWAERPGVMREKSRDNYHRHKDKHAEKNRQRAAKWRSENRDQFLEYMRGYVRKNSALQVAKAAAWSVSNPAKMRAARSAWKVANKDKVNATDAKRRAMLLNAMPKWLTESQKAEITDVYRVARRLTKATGEQYHVDHIAPLVGLRVCGLHVPWNLRVMLAKDNYRKSNKHD